MQCATVEPKNLDESRLVHTSEFVVSLLIRNCFNIYHKSLMTTTQMRLIMEYSTNEFTKHLVSFSESVG
jgi:hypothetical protein